MLDFPKPNNSLLVIMLAPIANRKNPMATCFSTKSKLPLMPTSDMGMSPCYNWVLRSSTMFWKRDKGNLDMLLNLLSSPRTKPT
eukprot:c44174_g1_i1 orf=6-257(-)